MVFLVVLFQVVCHNLLGLGMHCFKFFCISKFSLRNQLCFNRFFFINYLLLSLINFNTLSLICLPRVLTMRDQGDFLFSFCLLGSFWASYICIGVSFLSLGNFSSMIMLKAWSMPLTWHSSPSYMIHNSKVWIFIVSHIFPMFLTHFI